MLSCVFPGIADVTGSEEASVENNGERAVNSVLLQIEPYLPLLNISGLALGFWALFLPQPYDLCLAAIILAPVATVGLVFMSNGRWTLNGSRGERRPSLTGPFVLPALAALVRGFEDFRVVDWHAPLVLALSLAVVLMGVVAIADKATVKSANLLIFTFLIVAAWSFGVAWLTNGRFDTSPGTTYRTTLLNKWVRHGKSTTWHLRLAPWGPLGEPEDIEVPQAVYNSLSPGGDVCPSLHPGAFGWRWYAVHACAVPL